MNFLDILFSVAFVYAAWTGFKKGLIISLFTFLALFIGLYAGIHFSDYGAKILRFDLGMESEYVPLISFIVVFLAVGAMVYFGGKALEKVIKVIQLNALNKLLGIVFSVLRTTFFLGSFILIIEGFDERNDFIPEETKEGSLLYYPIKSAVLICIPAFEESMLFVKNSMHSEEEKANTETNDSDVKPL